MKIEKLSEEAIKLAKKIEKSNGAVEVKDVQLEGGEYAGYDLLSIYPNGKKLKIEVKGATRFHGIPDPYITEFDKETREMKADYFYVFYFPRDEDEPKYGSKPIFYKIPKEAIKSNNLEIKEGWKIKKFKKVMDNFKQEFSL